MQPLGCSVYVFETLRLILKFLCSVLESGVVRTEKAIENDTPHRKRPGVSFKTQIHTTFANNSEVLSTVTLGKHHVALNESNDFTFGFEFFELVVVHFSERL